MFASVRGLAEMNVCLEVGQGGCDQVQIVSIELCDEYGNIKDVTRQTDQGVHFCESELIEYLGVDETMINYQYV